MEERPGSWHHAMRVSVLSRVNGMKNWQRCAWFASSAALVAVQLIAVLTFIAGLSWKKCMHVDGMEERDCLPGFYCGGVRFLDPDVDVFDERKQLVLRGTCYECSSAVLGGQLLGLLDAMCPGGSIPGVGIDPSLDDDCIKKCYLAQVGPCANMTSRAQPYHGIPSHTMDYSLSDRSCAAFCTARCVAAMPTEAKDWFERANAEIAIENNPGFNRFLTWMSIRDQCGQCEPSRRLSKLYMTVSEAHTVAAWASARPTSPRRSWNHTRRARASWLVRWRSCTPASGNLRAVAMGRGRVTWRGNQTMWREARWMAGRASR